MGVFSGLDALAEFRLGLPPGTPAPRKPPSKTETVQFVTKDRNEINFLSYSANMMPYRIESFTADNVVFFYRMKRSDREIFLADLKDETLSIMWVAYVAAIKRVDELISKAKVSGVWDSLHHNQKDRVSKSESNGSKTI